MPRGRAPGKQRCTLSSAILLQACLAWTPPARQLRNGVVLTKHGQCQFALESTPCFFCTFVIVYAWQRKHVRGGVSLELPVQFSGSTSAQIRSLRRTGHREMRGGARISSASWDCCETRLPRRNRPRIIYVSNIG